MSSKFEQTLTDSVLNSFIDQTHYLTNRELAPSLITNTVKDNTWMALRAQLEHCKSFSFAVAFITLDMLAPLKVILADLAIKGIKGRLLTDNYLQFNNPAVFEELLKLKNVEVRLAQTQGFHVKGYLFEHENYTSAIIGSANLTRSALLVNKEWNLQVNSLQNGQLTEQFKNEYRALWQDSIALSAEWLAEYKKTYQEQKRITRAKANLEITPNKMQKQALLALSKLRKTGAKRGLVVSATGTGKTYLAALDVKQYQPQRFLFIVHREQILKKACASFQTIIGGQKDDFGFLVGQKRQIRAKYLFATVQTLAKPEVQALFSPSDFEYILIDEAHRSGAKSYQQLFAYFKPKFWLGMTATPERSDDVSIFELFDYNVAYEIRLQDALSENMLAPFHYIGLQDYEYAGKLIDDKTPLNKLASSERVNYILEQLKYYGDSSLKTRGLIFCSRQEEAFELAELLTKRGHNSQALTNQQSVITRQNAVKKLENGQLEYLITVDIFNEGIDIPCVNQVVLLRNTQSSIVFIQQLGRGLRKYPNKEYVTILDFIGNYKNNYLIPLALSGDRSCSRDNARTTLALQQTIGISTINFTKIAQKQIYAALQAVKLDALKNLREQYRELKAQLGRIPLLYDFQRFGSIDARVWAKNNSLDNYASFLQKEGVKCQLSLYAQQVLTFVTKELVNGMRAHELILLDMLMKKNEVSKEEYLTELRQHNCYISMDVLQSVNQILMLDFFRIKAGAKLKAEQYGDKPLMQYQNDSYYLNGELQACLRQEVWFKRLFEDVIKTGLLITQEYNPAKQFTRFKKYTRKDVCRLLNWPKDVSAPMYGYRVGEKECPIFITYQKATDIKAALRYQNEFSTNGIIRWFTRSPRHMDSTEVKQLLTGVKEHRQKIVLQLFVKRSDAEGKGFYYLGNANILPDSIKEEQLPIPNKKAKQVVGMDLQLQQALSSYEYRLLTGE